MRVFLAGATGAVGRQLVPMLLAVGHQVTGTTRDARRAERLRASGADAAIVDAYDGAAVRDAMRAAAPDIVIHQLTDLAAGFDQAQLVANSRLREVGTKSLVDAMLELHVARIVAQSGAWLYAVGDGPRTEDDPLRDETADDPVLRGILILERLVLRTPGIAGTVLRYGFLYGPGTAYAARADIASGPTVHVAAAARAAHLAAERGQTGIFNIVDDGAGISARRARDLLGWAP